MAHAILDIEDVTAVTAEAAIPTMREFTKAEYWSEKMVRAYNRADCASTTLRGSGGVAYRVSLSSGRVFDVVQIYADGSERFFRA